MHLVDTLTTHQPQSQQSFSHIPLWRGGSGRMGQETGSVILVEHLAL